MARALRTGHRRRAHASGAGCRVDRLLRPQGTRRPGVLSLRGRGRGRRPLADGLRTARVERVEIVGLATDHCVRATALGARAAGLGTTVLLELTAAVDPSRTDDVAAELRAAGCDVR